VSWSTELASTDCLEPGRLDHLLGLVYDCEGDCGLSCLDQVLLGRDQI